MILAGEEEWRGVPLDEQRVLYWQGECFYYWSDEQTVAPFGGDPTLKSVFSHNTLAEAIQRLEGRFVGLLA